MARASSKFLTPDDPQRFTLGPQITPDGASMYYVDIPLGGSRSIRRQTPIGGSDELVRSDAHRVALFPSGDRYLFADSNDASHLWAVDVDGSNLLKLVSVAGTNPAVSPDGSQVAYLRWDDAATCSHVERVASDGSQVDAPTRIVDCAQTGENITQLEWVNLP